MEEPSSNSDKCKNCNADLIHTIGKKKKIYCCCECRFNFWLKNHKERFAQLNYGYKKNSIARWKALNLCLRCGKPRAENKTRCINCLKYFEDYKNKKKEESLKTA